MENAAIVLGLAAIGGLTLAGIRLSGKPRPPTWMALGHGVRSACSSWPPLGGAGIFLGYHVRERELPIPLVLGHGLVAATGYVILLVSVFGRG